MSLADRFVNETRGVPDESVAVESTSDSGTVRIIAHKPRTDAQVIEASGFDPAVWQIEKARKWTTPMKVREDGQDRPLQLWNYHYTFKRAIPEYVEALERSLLAEWKPPKIAAPPRRRKGMDDLAVWSFYDIHFGKRSWAPETGVNSDLSMTRQEFDVATHDLLNKIGHRKINRFLVPVGNDFFHIDNWANQTTGGTQMEYDSRYPKVYQTGFECIHNAIMLMREIAPVDLFYVPGNHDRNSAWHLTWDLAARFAGDKHVSVDYAPTKYKERRFGVTQFFYLHGDSPRDVKEIALLASVKCEGWSSARFREVHAGHKHTKKELSILPRHEEVKGTLVRWLPSLSATDSWHNDNGYVGNHRAAECYLYNEEDGPNGYEISYVKDSK